MTKIKVDIESDETIVSAKILLKHLNGQTTVEDVITENESMLDKMNNRIGVRKTVSEKNIDPAFKETY